MTRLLAVCVASLSMLSCVDDDSFTTSPSARLTLPADTLTLDTVFSTVPSSTYSFWALNESGDGLRCTTVRLESGNQTGFRVNVDGSYLGSSAGYRVNDVEIRDNDSICVFVELTAPVNNSDAPVTVEDNLVFTLESGVEQKMCLRAYSWDAKMMSNAVIRADTAISGEKPIVVSGSLTVAEGATLTILPGATLYFNSDAGMDVYGRLLCRGDADAKVEMRTVRLDRMFDYLPYNYVSGMWQGVRFHEPSYENELSYTDIHGSFDGIAVDSADIERQKLTIENSTVHNCQGTALGAANARMTISNCEFSNTLGNCVSIEGGNVDMNNCTLAQFYPYDSNRGAALSVVQPAFSPASFVCRNTLITGYADDEVSIVRDESGTAGFDFSFHNCVMRTPRVETEDSLRFHDVVFEEYSDTTQGGKKHFVKIDTDNLRYDFRLSGTSAAIDSADPATATAADHDGIMRDERPDIGAYEYHADRQSKVKLKTKRQ